MVAETESSNRRLVIALAVGALILALVVGIIIIGIILSGDSDEGAALAMSAKLMPEDTFAFVTFNPQLDQAENYQIVENAWGENPLIELGLQEMLSSMKEGGIDYETDIEPWLGDEISVGLMGDLTAMMFQGVDMSLIGAPGQSPGLDEMPQIPQFIIAAATNNSTASDAFLYKLRTEAVQGDIDWQETEYSNVQIVYAEPDAQGQPGIAYATFAIEETDFVVLAVGGLEAMQAAIDARQGDNLTGNQSYQDVMDQLPSDQIGYGYVDLGALMDAALEAAAPELAEIPSELFNPEQLQAFRGMGFSVGLAANGLKVDYVMVYDNDALPEDMPGAQVSADKASERVPANTLLYLSGTGLGSFIEMGLDAIQSMPDQPEDLEDQLQMLTAVLGVSIDELIEMLSGEFALAVVQDAAGIGGDPSLPIGVSVLIESKDEEKFQKLLNSISALLALDAGVELPKETINGVEVTTLVDPSTGDMIAGWGVGSGAYEHSFFAIGTSRELLEAAFSGGENLADDAGFDAALAPLPTTKSGTFYIDLEGLLQFIDEMVDPARSTDFAEARSLFDPVKAISAAAEPFDKNKNAMSGTFFILIESE